MMIFIDPNRPGPDMKKLFGYSGVLFPELFKEFYNSTKETYFSFKKGKNILLYPRTETMLKKQFIFKIMIETSFLERNIISAKNIPEILAFIDEAKIDFFFDKRFSEDLWVHRSDHDFIYKMKGFDLYYWKDNLKNRVFYKNLSRKTVHFYIISRKDKVLLNQLVSADIVNKSGIKFCLSKNNALSISIKEVSKLKEKLKKKNLEIMLSNQNMFSIFQE